MASKRFASGSGGRPRTAVLVLRFLGVSALAGVLLAGVLLPAVGTLGVSAKDTAQTFENLPGDFKRPPLSQASEIYDADDDLIAKVFERNRTVVKGEDIAPVMRKAQVAIEDSRFYEHGAVDLKAVLRALNTNAQGSGVSQGGSTLTQQYVKNVFVEKAGNDPKAVAKAQRQSIGRKIKELKYAIKVEEELSKERILTNYLNITFFGEHAYGVEAAAQRYFSTHAKDLTLSQAAMLAGLVQSPSEYDPLTHPKTAKHRRNVVLHRMAQTGSTDKAAVAKAEKEPLGLKVSHTKNGCITAKQGAGFFCDYVRNVMQHNKVFGKTKKERQELWRTGGLKIHTTLQPQAQKAAQKAVKQHVYPGDPIASAVSMVEPGTGRITAMAQSRPYGFKKNQTQINYSVNHDMGGGLGSQPGSTFKPITAAAAMENGYGPSTKLPAPYRIKWPTVKDCSGKSYADPGSVPNEQKSEVGPYNMREALAKSVNTYFVQLEAKTGLCSVMKMSHKLGIDKRAGGAELSPGGTFTLGVNEMSPLTMANAYATFANRGEYCSPIAIDSVTGPYGKKIKVPESNCHRAMSKKTADLMSGLLHGVVEDGSGKAAGLHSRPSAGKTGTTDERYSAWFAGYTPKMSGAVWMGDPQRKNKMIDIKIGPKYYSKVYGADGPAPIWNAAMSGALDGQPKGSFKKVKLPPKHTKSKSDKSKKKKKHGHHGHKTADRSGGDHGHDHKKPHIDLDDLLPDR